MDRGVWWGHGPWGRKELDMTEKPTLSLSTDPKASAAHSSLFIHSLSTEAPRDSL